MSLTHVRSTTAKPVGLPLPFTFVRQNSIGSFRWCISENPRTDAKMLLISLTQAELWPILSQISLLWKQKSPVGYRTLDVSTTTAGLFCADVPLRNYSLTHYSLYLETRVGCVRCGRLRLTSSNCQTLNPLPSVRCKDLSNICCASQGIAHCVLNFIAMAMRVG